MTEFEKARWRAANHTPSSEASSAYVLILVGIVVCSAIASTIF